MGVHLFIPTDYGLANRLRGYVGAWAHAKQRGCELHVLWNESPACPYRIEEMFEPLPSTKFITEAIRASTVYDHSTSDLGHLSHILAKANISPALAPILIASLVPVAPIRQKLRELYHSTPLSEAIGLHIRRTDHVGYANECGGSTSLDLFWQFADKNPDRPIFLACDDPDTLRQARERYGNRIHVSKSFMPSSQALRKTDGEHAVLDIYCLALCNQFQGSNASSFSAHANYLRTAWTMSSSLLNKIEIQVQRGKEKLVFSFSLYGSNKKYTEGMVINARQISERFPSARIHIYIADDVPSEIVEKLRSYSAVHLIPVKRELGSINMFDRFYAIDDPECDLLFVRDADSRIHDRDVACIEDFVASDKLLHIIRDHKGHNTLIMGGIWGIRKKALLGQSLKDIIQRWLNDNGHPRNYGMDQVFLGRVIYPMLVKSAMIHDANMHFRQSESVFQPFRVDVVNKLFVGQVHDFNEEGEEILIYDIN